MKCDFQEPKAGLLCNPPRLVKDGRFSSIEGIPLVSMDIEVNKNSWFRKLKYTLKVRTFSRKMSNHSFYLDTNLLVFETLYYYGRVLFFDIMGLNTWSHSISVNFKSHSISVTFKFCAMRIALCELEPRSTDSLGTQHQNLNVTLIEWHQVFTP